MSMTSDRTDIAPELTDNARQVLAARYLTRDESGRPAETPAGLFRRVARIVAAAERQHGAKPAEVRRWAGRFQTIMASGQFLPNSPTLMNAGTALGQLSACFVIPVHDSIESIFYALKAAAEIHKSGGGTGFDFSEIRPQGDLVRSTGGRASGPVSFIGVFDQVTEVIRQGGRRRGANMGILRVDHPDILEFIEVKGHDQRLRNFNLSVAVTDAFMRAVQAGGRFSCRNPRTGRTVARLDARQVFSRIVRCAWRSGDPGVIFIDRINRFNPTRHLGRIVSTNPCGEVPLHPWESCNLGSINLAKCVSGPFLAGRLDTAKLKGLVTDAVRFLDDVITVNRYPLAECRQAADGNRRIGLGVMGLAEALIMMGIPYDSDRAVRTAGRLAKLVADQAHQASAELAGERGSFPNFRGSLWQQRGWKRMRNATATTVAPTGTISVLAGCSSGIEPLFAVSFVRNVLDGRRLIETSPLFEELARRQGLWSRKLALEVAASGSVKTVKGLSAAHKRLFRTALEIPVRRHVQMQAAFQRQVDNAVSKTVNLPASARPSQVRSAFLLAWRSGCKGVTVYRYGSKPEQVLTVGPVSGSGAGRRPLVSAGQEYAGGCPSGICAYNPT